MVNIYKVVFINQDVVNRVHYHSSWFKCDKIVPFSFQYVVVHAGGSYNVCCNIPSMCVSYANTQYTHSLYIYVLHIENICRGVIFSLIIFFFFFFFFAFFLFTHFDSLSLQSFTTNISFISTNTMWSLRGWKWFFHRMVWYAHFI